MNVASPPCIRLFLVASAISLIGACVPPSQNPTPAQSDTTASALVATTTLPADTLPAELCNLPADIPAPSASQAEFSEYSWKLFVALNWPAQSGQRGTPDCDAAFGSSGRSVWETYKTSEQIFLPNAQDPGPWNEGSQDTVRLLRFRSKAPSVLPLENSIQQAVGGWLIDQKGHPTYYQIAVDEASYQYVRSNGYYNANTLNSAALIDFPDGSLEIKASWRIMDGDDESRYHTTQARVMQYDAQGAATGKYQSATIGLVGLHVVYKAPGFPQWIWATFEQVDNAPLQANAATATAHYAYFNPQCTGQYCAQNTAPVTNMVPFDTPNPITRITPIRAGTASTNATWQARLAGTVYANYELISPQWPSDPLNPGNPQGTPTPGTVANVTMESYVQPTSSCMDCHSTARTPNSRTKTNYSFIFLFARTPQPGSDQP